MIFEPSPNHFLPWSLRDFLFTAVQRAVRFIDLLLIKLHCRHPCLGDLPSAENNAGEPSGGVAEISHASLIALCLTSWWSENCSVSYYNGSVVHEKSYNVVRKWEEHGPIIFPKSYFTLGSNTQFSYRCYPEWKLDWILQSEITDSERSLQ